MGAYMKLNLFFFLSAAAILLLSFTPAEQYNYEGGVRGVVQLPESRVTQPSPVGRYRRGAPQQQTQSQGPVLIWLVDQNGNSKTANEPVILDQENLEFTPQILAVRKGEYVRIRNSDPVYHNVFSLSSIKRFDVGRRPQGEYLDVKFDKEGAVDVFCDIHSNMHATVYVVESITYSWVSAKSGDEFHFTALPDGRYTLKIFSPGQNLYSSEVVIQGGETKDLGTIILR